MTGDDSEAVLRLAAIVDSSDDAIISKTLDGIVTSWNPGAERMFGYTAAEVVGRSITLIIPGDRLNEEDSVLRRLRRGESVNHYETVRMRKDGAFVNISLSVSPLRNATGTITGASKIARDVTSAKPAETERGVLLARERAARAEAEKANRIKDEFLATLSHELRTPLNAMLGWTRMLRARSLDPETSARALETIDRNIQLLTRLVEDVLDVSRITTGTMRLDARPVVLAPVIEAAVESVRPAARAKAIQVGLFLDPSVGPVAGDASRLQQVAWNLVSNAIKFTPRDGRVEIHLEERESQAQIRVTDTGKGITADFLPRVFDRFTQEDGSRTRAHSGLGLGLAIVRHLVELHGGTVAAESPGDGHGATFAVRLPLLPVQVSSADRGRRDRAVPADALAGIRVLVVVDDDDSRIVLAAVLEDAGAIAHAARSVGEALAALDHDAPDVVLCDISMPGQDGFAFLREARRRGGAAGRIPIVALTAHARDHEGKEALDAGFTSHLAKPAEPAPLVAELARLTGRGRG